MKSSEENWVGDEEFYGIARDPAVARLIRKQLEVLADGKGGPTMAEMAKEVLSGRLGLREAVRVSAYEEEMVKHIDKFRERWDSMSPEERRMAEKEGEKFLDQQRDEIEEERRSRAEERRAPAGKHQGKGWSLY